MGETDDARQPEVSPAADRPSDVQAKDEAEGGAKSTSVSSFPPPRPASKRPSAPRVAPAKPPLAKGEGPLGAYEALARSARLSDLVAIATSVLDEAAKGKRPGFAFVAKVGAAAEEAKLARADADTPYGNALSVLEAGPEGEAERALACALAAHVVAEAPRGDEDRVASDVLWLATHTAFDATALIDRALGEDADELWASIADRVRRASAGRGTALGRGEAIVGCAALVGSSSPAAARELEALSAELDDPVLLRVLDGAPARSEPVRLEGDAFTARRGPVVTTLLAFSGILLVASVVRVLARLALAYRRPTEITFDGDGVRVHTRTEMLGRTLREREHVIARAGLVRVVREVRYPRAAFYAGLFALALGSYVGVRALADGARVASPSLLLAGIVVVGAGVGLDFLLGSVLPGARGRCRISFVPRSGPAVCVADVDARHADDALRRALSSS